MSISSRITKEQFELAGRNPMLDMIPVQLHNLTPEQKAKLNEDFGETAFDCDECGGDVIPFNSLQGVCFHCKTVAELADLNFEAKIHDAEDY